MILKGKRRTSIPIIISKNNESSLLQRIPFSERVFNEDWLQQLIQNNSSLLPIEEIEPSFSELFAIGREIKTNVGFIDNLLINEDGYITIIETKLWRNLQARREVVGQIIDYAKELTKWTFDDLNNAVIQVSNKSIIEIAKLNADANEIDEKYFIDAVSKNLKRGRFLLLIVGDGIHESVEEMADYLQQFAQINFTLALIELQVYRNTIDDSTIILPQIITRTKEITRAIIKIENNSSNEINVDVLTNLEEVKYDKIQIKNTLTYDDFFQQLSANTSFEIVSFIKEVINEFESKGFVIEYGTSTIKIKYIPSVSDGYKVNLFIIDRKDFFYIWYVDNQLNRLNINTKIGRDFIEKSARIFNIGLKISNKNNWSRYPKLIELKNHYTEFKQCVFEFVENIEIETKNT